MSPALHWPDLLLRLLVTIAAAAVVGTNRIEQGKPAGLRTTILVSLAASTSMLLANLLLATTGRPANSFVQMDVMRLPLGILTGMGLSAPAPFFGAAISSSVSPPPLHFGWQL